MPICCISSTNNQDSKFRKSYKLALTHGLISFAVNGGYGSWGEFGDCSTSCGGGVRHRERKCDSPEPRFGGLTCEEQGLGPDVESQSCNEEPCPSKLELFKNA